MYPEVAKVLTDIDDLLAQGDVEARQLWALLSALRGPDEENKYSKTDTTARIRAAMFPLTWSRSVAEDDRWTYPHGAQYERPYDPFVLDDTLEVAVRENGDHFLSHVKQACDILRSAKRFQPKPPMER